MQDVRGIAQQAPMESKRQFGFCVKDVCDTMLGSLVPNCGSVQQTRSHQEMKRLNGNMARPLGTSFGSVLNDRSQALGPMHSLSREKCHTCSGSSVAGDEKEREASHAVTTKQHADTKVGKPGGWLTCSSSTSSSTSESSSSRSSSSKSSSRSHGCELQSHRCMPKRTRSYNDTNSPGNSPGRASSTSHRPAPSTSL